MHAMQSPSHTRVRAHAKFINAERGMLCCAGLFRFCHALCHAGFAIQRNFYLRICNPQHPQMVSDCKSDSLITPDYKSGVTGNGRGA